MNRIWHQSVNELDRIGPYRDALVRHASGILSKNTELVVHGLPVGTYRGLSPSDALGNAATYHRTLSPIVDMAITAEAENYDAFVIGSFSEPFLTEIRTAVDIPVISMTEAALLTSCSLGDRAAIIANDPNVEWLVRRSVRSHRLDKRVSVVTSLSPAVDEFVLSDAFKDPTSIIEQFKEQAKHLIAEGAETIIPGEGVLARLIGEFGLSDVDGVPVLDVFAIAWAQAEMHIQLWKTTKVRRGRSWSFKR